MNGLSQNDSQIRDSLIIELSINEDLRTGNTPVEIVQHMASKTGTLNYSQNSYELNAPLIFLEGERQDLSIPEYFLDPEINSNLVPLEIYLPKWAGFMNLLSSKKIVENQTKQEYAFDLLQRAVFNCRITYGSLIAKQLAQKLHDYRWSFGPEMTASLFTTALANNEENECKQLANDKTFLNEYIAKIRNLLNEIKNTCKNLTEWNEAIYSINPDIWELLKYLRYSNSNDAKKWYRFFEEADADITPSSMRATFSAIAQEKGEEIGGWLSLFNSEREASPTCGEFKKRLSYLLSARTSIPKFWMDLALLHYETPTNAIPKELYEVDPWNAVSIDILRSWSIRWSSNP